MLWYKSVSFFSEYTTLSDYKGSGSKRWTDCIFPLHCEWSQERQLSVVASGKKLFFVIFSQEDDCTIHTLLEVDDVEFTLLNMDI